MCHRGMGGAGGVYEKEKSEKGTMKDKRKKKEK
jgi:hypothetical protein